jgi:hypothetical protein
MDNDLDYRPQQDPHLNRGAYESFENVIYDCLNGTSKSATLTWGFTYASSSHTMPSQVRNAPCDLVLHTKAECLC